jgi:hypothetical protein
MSTLPLVNSFDVFDTLLARKVLNPCDIFSIIEETYPYPNYRKQRSDAQCSSNGSIDDTYVKFGEMYNVDKETCDKLKEFEIQTEINYSYLIMTNCKLVNDGDILISDMYLTGEQIMRILRSHGFNKDVTIYATPSGKSSGTIWPLLKEKYIIKKHMGDNMHSDINMAINAGISPKYTEIHKINDTEQFFIDNNLIEFGLTLRQFRHANPYMINTKEYELYNDQASFNIPLLILTSNKLYDILKKENRSKLLLITRDGCLLKHIFKVMYPSIECVELQSSRNVNRNPNEEYKSYLRSVYNKDTCLIFDIHGAFCSGRGLFKELFGCYPRVHLLGYDRFFKGSEPYPELTYTSTKCFESFNIDCVGSLIRLEDGNFIRAPIIEYEIANAIIYKDTVISFCKFITKYKDAIYLDNSLLELFIEKVARENVRHHFDFNSVQQKINSIAPIWNHQSLTNMADVLNVTKGSSVGCGHRYTEYYEILLSKWYNKPFSILEIGLGRYGTKSTPSLDLWKAYMDSNTKIYGFDSNHELEKFNNLSNNIHIYIGSQNDQEHVERCCRTTYDCIIDDGEHNSCGQQVMFKTLWKSLNPGGIYCIESLHWQPDTDYGMKTKDLLMSWKDGKVCTTYFINQEEADSIYKSIAAIEFYPSKSQKWDPEEVKHAFCVVRKI